MWYTGNMWYSVVFKGKNLYHIAAGHVVHVVQVNPQNYVIWFVTGGARIFWRAPSVGTEKPAPSVPGAGGCLAVSARWSGGGLGVRELAAAAGVTPETVVRLERGENLRPRTLAAIRAALESAGVEFLDENGGGPGVRLRR